MNFQSLTSIEQITEQVVSQIQTVPFPKAQANMLPPCSHEMNPLLLWQSSGREKLPVILSSSSKHLKNAHFQIIKH